MLVDKTLSNFLDETASSSPAPGGGTVSALAGSLAAALTSMVCQLTIGKKKYVDVDALMRTTHERSAAVLSTMRAIIDEDTAAFNEVMSAFSMPKATDEEKLARSKAIQTATVKATEVPLKLVRECGTCAELVEVVAKSGNKNSASDAGVAALMLSAAVRGAALNVYINLSGLKDETFVEKTRRECEAMEKQVTQRCEAVSNAVRESLI